MLFSQSPLSLAARAVCLLPLLRERGGGEGGSCTLRPHSAPAGSLCAARKRTRHGSLYRTPSNTVPPPGVGSAVFGPHSVPLRPFRKAYVPSRGNACIREVNIMGARINNYDNFRHQNDYDLPAGRMLRVQRARGWAVYCEFGEL